MKAIHSVQIAEARGLAHTVSLPWDVKILGVTWTKNNANIIFSGSYDAQGKMRKFVVLSIGDPVTDEVCLGLHPNGLYSLWEVKA